MEKLLVVAHNDPGSDTSQIKMSADPMKFIEEAHNSFKLEHSIYNIYKQIFNSKVKATIMLESHRRTAKKFLGKTIFN